MASTRTPFIRAGSAPHLPAALCAGRHPTLTPDDWIRDKRDEVTQRAERSCLVLCPELDACRAWAEAHRPPAGVWAGRWRG